MKAVIFGAGNIGRGFIGQLFSESGYEVIFIDINTEIVNALNSGGRYPVRVLGHDRTEDIWVDRVSGIDGRNADKVVEAVSDADIMATAVGIHALPVIAKSIAAGLKRRWKTRNDPLNILICENMLDADEYLGSLIKKELEPGLIHIFDERVGLVETVVGRMVPVMTREMQDGNILRICVEEFCELPVDKDAFKGSIPAIKNMIPSTPFSFFVRRKLFIHNMGHAITAYLGYLKGYQYIADAIENPVIRKIATDAMISSALALSKNYSLRPDETFDCVYDLIYRFGNKQLGDTISRVGRDARRKLSSNDRLVGAARLCNDNNVNAESICIGIAAAVKFLQHEENRYMEAEEVLEKICMIKEERILFDMILRFYKELDCLLPD